MICNTTKSDLLDYDKLSWKLSFIQRMVFFIFLICSTLIILTQGKFCDHNELIKPWRKECFKEQDHDVLSYIRKYYAEKEISNYKLKDDYYRTISRTVQNSCQIVKQLTGRWANECGFLDGEKLICMDGFYEAVINNTCLVYSFGLADNWDFEMLMASLGK